jgi:hypothetical protein
LANVKDTAELQKVFLKNGIFYTSFEPVVIDYPSQYSQNQFWTIAQKSDSLDWPKSGSIIYDAPFCFTQDSVEVGVSHLFYVKLRNMEDTLLLSEMSNTHNVTILGNSEYRPMWFTLACSNLSSDFPQSRADTGYSGQ